MTTSTNISKIMALLEQQAVLSISAGATNVNLTLSTQAPASSQLFDLEQCLTEDFSSNEASQHTIKQWSDFLNTHGKSQQSSSLISTLIKLFNQYQNSHSLSKHDWKTKTPQQLLLHRFYELLLIHSQDTPFTGCDRTGQNSKSSNAEKLLTLLNNEAKRNACFKILSCKNRNFTNGSIEQLYQQLSAANCFKDANTIRAELHRYLLSKKYDLSVEQLSSVDDFIATKAELNAAIANAPEKSTQEEVNFNFLQLPPIAASLQVLFAQHQADNAVAPAPAPTDSEPQVSRVSQASTIEVDYEYEHQSEKEGFLSQAQTFLSAKAGSRFLSTFGASHGQLNKLDDLRSITNNKEEALDISLAKALLVIARPRNTGYFFTANFAQTHSAKALFSYLQQSEESVIKTTMARLISDDYHNPFEFENSSFNQFSSALVNAKPSLERLASDLNQNSGQHYNNNQNSRLTLTALNI